MSRTTVLGVMPLRRPVTIAEFSNAWGWSPSIWDRLLAPDTNWFRDEAALNRLWADIENLPEWQQAPLVLTFDMGVIPHQEFKWASEQFEEFERRLPGDPQKVNHVPAMADLLRSGPEVPWVGVWGTTVTDNPFDPVHYCDGFDPPREVEGGCSFIAELGYCEGHPTPVPFEPGSGIYVLERHRKYLTESDS